MLDRKIIGEVLSLLKAAGIYGGLLVFTALMGGLAELASDPVRTNHSETFHHAWILHKGILSSM